MESVGPAVSNKPLLFLEEEEISHDNDQTILLPCPSSGFTQSISTSALQFSFEKGCPAAAALLGCERPAKRRTNEHGIPTSVIRFAPSQLTKQACAPISSFGIEEMNHLEEALCRRNSTEFSDSHDLPQRLYQRDFPWELPPEIHPPSSHEQLAKELSSHAKPYAQCDKCQKPFKLRQALKVHKCPELSKVPAPYLCGLCDEAFTNPFIVQNHVSIDCRIMRAQVGKQLKRVYMCGFCRLSYCSPTTLKKHVQRHMCDKR